MPDGHDHHDDEAATLRDQFAMSALNGMMASPHNPTVQPRQFAAASYLIADEMMLARQLPTGFAAEGFPDGH
jgi:hypothetical protein